MQRPKHQEGMSLIEVLIAMVITVVGVIAVATLIIYGIGLQVLSRDASMANSLAKAKIEELRVKPSTDPELAIGGSLTSNTADHFDTPAGFVRRWVVAAGPAGTLDVTIRVIAQTASSQVNPEVDIQVLLEN